MSDFDNEYEDDTNDKEEITDEYVDECDGNFDEEPDDIDELADECDGNFDEELDDVDELADEYDKDFDEELDDVDKLADKYDEDFDGELNDIDELADEYDEDFDGELNDVDELTEEYEEDLENGISSEEEVEMDVVLENIDSQSSILVHTDQNDTVKLDDLRNEAKEDKLENKEEIIVPDPKEYEKNQEPLYDPSEADFIRDMEELGRILKDADEKKGIPEEELKKYEDIGFNAEQHFRKVKEGNQEVKREEGKQEVSENQEELTQKSRKEHIKEENSNQELDEDPEDYPKEVETVHELEYFVNAEEKLYEKGKSSGEITEELEQIENLYDLTEEVEKIHKDQEKKKLKSIDHQDEEEGDEIKEIDRVDVIEHVIDKEKELQQENISQVEIDKEIEGALNEFYQEEKEEDGSIEQGNDKPEEYIPEQTTIKVETSAWQEREEIVYKKEQDIESLKAEKKSKKEYDFADLQQLYRRETGKRPIYAEKNTRGFNEWLEQLNIKKKELKEYHQKEKADETWKKVLDEGMKQFKEDILDPKLKIIIKELLQKAETLEQLFKNCENKNFDEKEQTYWRTVLKKNQMKFPFHLELYRNIREFKRFVQISHPWDIENIKHKFLQHLIQKYTILKQNSNRSIKVKPQKDAIIKTKPIKNNGRPRIQNELMSNNPSFKLLESIRNGLESIIKTRVTNSELSEFLGFYKNFITKKYRNIRNGKEGYITQESFNQIREIVKSFFRERNIKMSEILENTLKEYQKYLSKHHLIRSCNRSKKFHPNIKENFFEKIDSIFKTYWLGIMYSDGYIIEESDEYRRYYRIGLKVKIDDEILINRFIETLGLNSVRKHLYVENQKHGDKVAKVQYFRIIFANQKMANDLIRWGVIPNKSNLIRLPKFPVKEDYYPFLMGCFDGDGEAGTSRLWSGSQKFLEDIKVNFNIPNKINYRESRYGSAWGLSLGPKVFNKMIASYPNSLARKRKKMREWKNI